MHDESTGAKPTSPYDLAPGTRVRCLVTMIGEDGDLPAGSLGTVLESHPPRPWLAVLLGPSWDGWTYSVIVDGDQAPLEGPDDDGALAFRQSEVEPLD